MVWKIVLSEFGKAALTWLITQIIKSVCGSRYNPSWNQYIAWGVAAVLTVVAESIGVAVIPDPALSTAVSGGGANLGHSVGNIMVDGVRKVKANMRRNAQGK